MTIEGRINVDCLFHDRDGTTAIKVVSLRSSNEYATGKAAIITGTAGTASVGFNYFGAVAYPDVTGTESAFQTVKHIAFAWSGSQRTLSGSVDEFDTLAYVLPSSAGRAAIISCDINTDATPSATHVISGGAGTGTYTIVLYGT